MLREKSLSETLRTNYSIRTTLLYADISKIESPLDKSNM